MPTFSEPPITPTQASTATYWLKQHFGRQMQEAVQDSEFSVDHLCGIACQETAYFWLNFINRLSPEEVLRYCVLDGSGDYRPNQNPRSAFPRNTRAFRERYDEQDPGFATMLIAEGNQARRIRGLSPVDWLYKGYGIFQYDLQFVERDPMFFREKQWYRIEECLKRVMHELRGTWARHGRHFEAIRSYNGSGARAHRYAVNVMGYTELAARVANLA